MQRPSNMRLGIPVVAVGALVLAGCGGPIVFQGQKAIDIAGTSPAPPPPPPEPEPEPRVKLVDNKIQISEKIQFDYNTANIKEISHSLLNEVAQVMKDNPHVKKVRIEGHASSEGADDYNMRLSDDRAKAVMTYLVQQAGVDAGRLTAQGYGETKPIASNETEAGREKNRRVEFNVIEQDVTQKEVKVDPETGEVIEEKPVSPSTNKVKKPGQ